MALIFAAASLHAAPEKYFIDRAHSSMGFSIRHLMVSNVKGEFREFSGTIMLDEADPANSNVEVAINAASIDTENGKRDDHLRSADFFDVQNHPEITFKSTKVEKTADGFMIFGDFTLRGVTKAISFPATMLGKITGMGGETRVGFEAFTKINRKDFGMTWNKALDAGGVVLSEEVKIELNIEAVKE
jgi:polyisoprenoid-binding protein YceI